jgi:hypothetical protein
MASVVTADFLNKAEDSGVREMLEFASQLANEEVRGAEQFLRKDDRPLPEPFTERDVDLNGPERFSDNYVLLLKYKLALDALPVYGLAMAQHITRRFEHTSRCVKIKRQNLLIVVPHLLLKRAWTNL